MVNRGHDLIAHLDELGAVAAEVGHTLSSKLREYVTYMNDFDPNSQHWRYPEVKAKKGMLLSPSHGTKEIDVGHFVESSNQAFDELDEICYWRWERENQRMMEEAGIGYGEAAEAE